MKFATPHHNTKALSKCLKMPLIIFWSFPQNFFSMEAKLSYYHLCTLPFCQTVRILIPLRSFLQKSGSIF